MIWILFSFPSFGEQLVSWDTEGFNWKCIQVYSVLKLRSCLMYLLNIYNIFLLLSYKLYYLLFLMSHLQLPPLYYTTILLYQFQNDLSNLSTSVNYLTDLVIWLGYVWLNCLGHLIFSLFLFDRSPSWQVSQILYMQKLMFMSTSMILSWMYLL